MIYLYEHPETGEIKEVWQGMNDVHEYEENGVAWNRVFTSPNANIDTKIDPFNSRDFVEKTRNKKGTFGDLLDASKEASEKRADKVGDVDPYRKKMWDKHKKDFGGKPHPDQIKYNQEKIVGK